MQCHTTRGCYKSAHLAKSLDVDEYFTFMDSDDRLEQLFGIIRTLSGQNRNFDMLELESNIGIATSIAQYFVVYPEKRRGSRKLSASLDHWNPVSWTGCTKTSNVDLAQCWRAGARDAAVVLRRGGLFTEAEVDWAALANEALAPHKRTMLRPEGSEVGVLGGA